MIIKTGDMKPIIKRGNDDPDDAADCKITSVLTEKDPEADEKAEKMLDSVKKDAKEIKEDGNNIVSKKSLSN